MAARNNDNIPVLTPYNPLDKRHLGEQVAEALLEQDVQPLPPSRFIGAGVYALYYIGNFPAYAALTEVNKDDQYLCPIYVGKAVPEGARKGGQGEDVDPGRENRHFLLVRNSIAKAESDYYSNQELKLNRISVADLQPVSNNPTELFMAGEDSTALELSIIYHQSVAIN